MARSVGLPQDFEVYYEMLLGIRREANGDGDGPPPGGSDHAAGRSADARANGGADLAVFEQFERMVRWLLCLVASDTLLSYCCIGW